jgi:hypothetical protein
MGKFILPPDGKEPSGFFLPGRKFQIEEPVMFQSELEHKGKKIGTHTVEPGTITDFASVPRFFWRILTPMDDDVRMPAIVHDDLYNRQIWPKKVADQIFLEALLAHGAPLWKRQVMYRAVCIFGKKAWNDHKREKERLAIQHDMIDTPGKLPLRFR